MALSSPRRIAESSLNDSSIAPQETDGAKSTLASAVYRRLRHDLLYGIIEPATKLRVEWVVATYGAGASPVREALNRLASEGLLGRHDQRGFFVMPVSASELEELTRTRCWLEERALRETLANRTPEWEEALVLSLHRLSRTPRYFDGDPAATNPDWERLHRVFHRALIAECRSRWLLGFCDQLADQAHRYRQIARTGPSARRDELSEHRAIADKAIAGDVEGAVAALTAHYRLTSEISERQLETISKASADRSAKGRRPPRAGRSETGSD
jgi:DNA-binding GntR family transcriptional regulator